MRRTLVFAGLAILLAACVSTTVIPKGYTGPLAYFQDTATQRNPWIFDRFVLAKVNEVFVPNFKDPGPFKGPNAQTTVVGRNVPTQEASFTIEGSTFFVANIIALTHKYQFYIMGNVHFTPQPGHRYLVKGKLSEQYCGVWIEDAQTGEVVGTKTEVDGASYLSKWDGRPRVDPAP